MKIILVEFIDEIKTIEQVLGNEMLVAKDTKIVCLDPKVRAYLNARGIDSTDTLAYFDTASHHQIVLQTEALLKQFEDKFRLESVSIYLKQSFQKTFNYYFRSYVSYCLWVLEVLGNLKKKENSFEIVCCLTASAMDSRGRQPFIQNTERPLGFLIKDFCQVHNIRFQAVKHNVSESDVLENILKAIITPFAKVLCRLDLWCVLRKFTLNDKVVVVPGTSYRMGKVLQEIRSKNFSVRAVMIWQGKETLKGILYHIVSISKNIFARVKKQNVVETILPLELLRENNENDLNFSQARKLLDQIVSEINSSGQQDFVWSGVDFKSYITGKLNNGFKFFVKDLFLSTACLERLLKKLSPKLIMSMYSVGVYDVMGSLSRDNRFASLNISHGTHVPPNNLHEKIENYRLAHSVILNSYEEVAVQSPWADKFLDYYKDSRPRVKCGPLLYAVVNSKKKQQKRDEFFQTRPEGKIIVHATTQKTRYNLRFHIEETLDEYVESLKHMVTAINQLKNVYLVIRPHPISDLTEEDFKQLLPVSNKYVVMKKGSFEKVLSMADLLVSYSSTCIEEALQNRIPVLLFDQWNRYNHFNVAEIKDPEFLNRYPAYYLTKPDLLKGTMNQILSIFGAEPLKDDELQEFKYPSENKRFFDQYIEDKLGKSVEGVKVS